MNILVPEDKKLVTSVAEGIEAIMRHACFTPNTYNVHMDTHDYTDGVVKLIYKHSAICIAHIRYNKVTLATEYFCTGVMKAAPIPAGSLSVLPALVDKAIIAAISVYTTPTVSTYANSVRVMHNRIAKAVNPKLAK